MRRILLANARITTGEYSRIGALAIEGSDIFGIWLRGDGESDDRNAMEAFPGAEIIDLGGKVLMAGGIDAHVHFREPGMTQKADIASESRAALLGGITSFVDMPNTNPPTTTMEALEDKLQRASETSWCNYGFHIGATNTNAEKINEYIAEGLGDKFMGIKVFMGSSTGNMLVDRDEALKNIFRIKGKTILVHSEDEGIIKANLMAAKGKFGDEIPFSRHPLIRSREACVKSTRKAIGLAEEYGASLHILHISTADEIDMIREAKARGIHVTAETSANYLTFDDSFYEKMEGHIKCNPAIKTAEDRKALRKAFADGVIDTIGSDHAPHLLSEKQRPYLNCPSGVPSVQQSLPAVITIANEYGIPLTRVASAYSENIASILGITRRGFLKPGFRADLIVLDPEESFIVGEPAYKCGWSPYEGMHLQGAIKMVFLNGRLMARDGRMVAQGHNAQKLQTY
jgi:dihydroorotase